MRAQEAFSPAAGSEGFARAGAEDRDRAGRLIARGGHEHGTCAYRDRRAARCRGADVAYVYRLPATSVCVEIGWVVVFASLTKSVNRWSSFRAASDTLNPLAHPWRIGDASPVRRARREGREGGGSGRGASREPLIYSPFLSIL